MPPSAMIGIAPSTPSTASMIADSWGSPTPVTTRVVQIEPGPTPTFTASTPRSASARAPPTVPTFPPTSWTSGKASRTRDTAWRTPSECPCAVSTTRTSTPASTRSRARSRSVGDAPTAAPARSRPCSSLHAFGYMRRLKMSLTVIRPFRCPASSTTGSFSIRCSCRIACACSSVVPTGTVTRFSDVITVAVDAGAAERFDELS